jgi:hypothetical protein
VISQLTALRDRLNGMIEFLAGLIEAGLLLPEQSATTAD